MKMRMYTQRKYRCLSLTTKPEYIINYIKMNRTKTQEASTLYKYREKLTKTLEFIQTTNIKEPLHIALYMKTLEKQGEYRDLGIPVSLDVKYLYMIAILRRLELLGFLTKRECTPIEKDWVYLTTKLMNRIIKTRETYTIIINGEKINIHPANPETLSYRHLLLALEFITPKKITEDDENEKRNVKLLYLAGILKQTKNNKYVITDLKILNTLIKTIEKRNKNIKQKIKKRIRKIKEKQYHYYYIPRNLLYKLKNIKKTRRIIDLPQLQEIEALIHELINTLDDAYLEEAENIMIELDNISVSELEKQAIHTRQFFHRALLNRLKNLSHM